MKWMFFYGVDSKTLANRNPVLYILTIQFGEAIYQTGKKKNLTGSILFHFLLFGTPSAVMNDE